MKYFDYTATTPVDKQVLETYVNTTNKFFANTTSLHKLGEESNHMYEICKKGICDILNLKHHNLVFTSNATEANNLAIFGIAGKYSTGKIITTKIEHPSVYNTIQSLESKFNVVYLDIDSNGIIDLKQLENELDESVVLVSIMWVNNIVGSIQPISEVIKMVKKYPKCHLHVDSVQGMCKVNPNFDFNDIDLFTFSTHKIYGPKGIGGLFYKDNISLEKRIYGSNSQYEVKPGTFDVSLIASTYKAFKIYYPLTSKHSEEVKLKFEYLYNHLKNNEKIRINTAKKNVSYYIMSINIIGIKGETLVHMLESKEIYVSTGSSCSSKLVKPEKTILAMTNDLDRSLQTIRISLSHLTTFSELDSLIEAINEITK